MAAKIGGLGKGINALLSVFDDEEQSFEPKDSGVQSKNSVLELEISKIYANPNQPRKKFDEDALNGLAESIKMHGVIQPIIVMQKEDGYMIIAGERRYRAAKIAQKEFIPCVIKDYSEKQIKEIAIIENLQRQDLNAIEAAKAIKALMKEYEFTQEQVAERIGLSRSNVANTLRLLNLSGDVLKMVEENKLAAGHARSLLGISDPKVQLKVATSIADTDMSVREVEKLIKKITEISKPKPKVEQSSELVELINDMQRVFATKVTAVGSDNKGRIYIDYFSRDDLDRICELVELVKIKSLTLKDLSEFNKRK